MRASAILLLLFASLVARADDWTTSDGTVYKNVKVVSHDAAFVTVMDSDGGARIALSDLPASIREQFGYDPDKAKAVAAAVLAQDQRDREERLAEARAALAQQAILSRAQHSSPLPPPAPVKVPATVPVASGQGASPTDVMANTEQIRLDQQKLDSVAEDIRVAQADVARDNSVVYNYDNHYDNTGSLHPNHVGTRPEDRLASLQKEQSDLQGEIVHLQQENAGVAQK